MYQALQLLRSYPKLKVNVAPRKIRWLLLPQIAEIGVIVHVDPICPLFAKSLTTSPCFIRAGASAGNLDVYIPTNICKAEVQAFWPSEVAEDTRKADQGSPYRC